MVKTFVCIFFQASLRNDSLLQSSIRIQNDTQKDTPNNKSAKGLSPQNSIRCSSNTHSSVAAQVNIFPFKTRNTSSKIFYFQGPTPPALTRKNSLNKSPVLPPKLNKTPSPIVSRKSSYIEPKSVNSLSEKGMVEKILPSINMSECITNTSPRLSVFDRLEVILEPTGCFKEKDDYSLYLFSPNNR